MGICFSSGVKLETPLEDNIVVSGHDSSEVEKKTSSVASPRVEAEGEILETPNLKSFSFSDLKMATRDFRVDCLLGGGDVGSVYKGWIDPSTFAPAKPKSGMAVAVKKLSQDSLQGQQDLLAEVKYLGQFCHPNVVKLIGYCLEDENRLLVFEFMARGCLEHHLFQRGSYFQPLSWNLRLKVALGVAKGLHLLHNSVEKLIYRDLKASNILLDSDYNAKLSTFGLAKDKPAVDEGHVTTNVIGTLGYAAPEYLVTGHLTTKSDVYSFGVVLVELLSGRRAIDKNKPSGEQSLIEWAKPYLANKRKIVNVMDNRLDGQYTDAAAYEIASLSLRCTSLDPKLRPEMGQVILELEKLVDSKAVDGFQRTLTRPRKRSAGDAVEKMIKKSTSMN